MISHYNNPDSLACRVLTNSDGYLLPNQLILDNYWQGAPIYWAATEEGLIDFRQVKSISTKSPQKLCAKWVEKGRLHQQYFSLSDPFGQDSQVDTSLNFIALNHLDTHARHYSAIPDVIYYTVEQPLVADVNFEQTVDITHLNLPDGQYFLGHTKDK
ncbi:hypothetical protein J4727_02945 [Providencia rettgeri]|uniref:Uncharacterized protein n=1 Tax=Providencia rettgeri TaxID=587 RepID=A0A939NFL3_PRORE|nr:hypothetical protein [Providencia rettgeri]